ncbi:ABC transporter permease subunit [Clostridium sp. LY3-2]|uniref:ABC transporter permease subunit n=1 Tax=Clostridium sp. LY3-2 TaxID=2942482 RepID=UPI002152F3B2|nr:ABC transporter permease subunit [Clostridium sp. LY3-2]MCR6516436.1 ABC transporter permease subunit [Clostridium sp. LY3-2]
MIHLIEFEVKKLFKSKIFISILLFIILASIFFTLQSLNFNKDDYYKTQLDNAKQNLILSNERIEKLQKELEVNPKDEQLKEDLFNEREENKYQSEFIRELNSKDDKLIMKAYIKEKSKFIELLDDGEEKNNLYYTIEKYKYALENNIDYSILREFEPNGINSILMSLRSIGFILPLIFIIIASIISTSEFENKTNKLLFLLPIKSKNIYLSKVLVSIFACLIIMIIFITIPFIITSIKFGVGELRAPIGLFNKEVIDSLSKYVNFEGISIIILKTMIYILSSIITISFLVIGFSTIFKNKTSSIVIFILLFSFLKYFNIENALINKLNYPKYLDYVLVVTGQSLLISESGLYLIHGVLLGGIIIVISSIIGINELNKFRNIKR